MGQPRSQRKIKHYMEINENKKKKQQQQGRLGKGQCETDEFEITENVYGYVQ